MDNASAIQPTIINACWTARDATPFNGRCAQRDTVMRVFRVASRVIPKEDADVLGENKQSPADILLLSRRSVDVQGGIERTAASDAASARWSNAQTAAKRDNHWLNGYGCLAIT